MDAGLDHVRADPSMDARGLATASLRAPHHPIKSKPTHISMHAGHKADKRTAALHRGSCGSQAECINIWSRGIPPPLFPFVFATPQIHPPISASEQSPVYRFSPHSHGQSLQCGIKMLSLQHQSMLLTSPCRIHHLLPKTTTPSREQVSSVSF